MRIAARDDSSARELSTAIRDRGRMALSIASVALYVAIIADMVAKPFS